jgi:hypothetical protein
MLDLSRRKGAGQGAKYTTKLSVNKHRMGSKAESNGGVISKWWIPELISWATRQYSKSNYPTLLGEEQKKQNCS